MTGGIALCFSCIPVSFLFLLLPLALILGGQQTGGAVRLGGRECGQGIRLMSQWIADGSRGAGDCVTSRRRGEGRGNGLVLSRSWFAAGPQYKYGGKRIKAVYFKRNGWKSCSTAAHCNRRESRARDNSAMLHYI